MTSVVILDCVTDFKIRLSKSKYNDIIDPKQGNYDFYRPLLFINAC